MRYFSKGGSNGLPNVIQRSFGSSDWLRSASCSTGSTTMSVVLGVPLPNDWALPAGLRQSTLTTLGMMLRLTSSNPVPVANSWNSSETGGEMTTSPLLGLTVITNTPSAPVRKASPSWMQVFQAAAVIAWLGCAAQVEARPSWRTNAERCEFLKLGGGEGCKAPVGQDVDHIIPYWEGGAHHPANMQLLDRPDHIAKTSKEASRRQRRLAIHSRDQPHLSPGLYRASVVRLRRDGISVDVEIPVGVAKATRIKKTIKLWGLQRGRRLPNRRQRKDLMKFLGKGERLVWVAKPTQRKAESVGVVFGPGELVASNTANSFAVGRGLADVVARDAIQGGIPRSRRGLKVSGLWSSLDTAVKESKVEGKGIWRGCREHKARLAVLRRELLARKRAAAKARREVRRQERERRRAAARQRHEERRRRWRDRQYEEEDDGYDGGGGGGTWVRPHFRGGSAVRGHWRSR